MVTLPKNQLFITKQKTTGTFLHTLKKGTEKITSRRLENGKVSKTQLPVSRNIYGK
jgi:hypothetical protein